MNIVVPATARVTDPDSYFTLNIEEEQDPDPHEKRA